MKKRAALAFLCSVWLSSAAAGADSLKINEKGYFARQGLNVMVFSDYYPEGHQTGVTIVQHGTRVAANGDLRLEASPGQWSPTPAVGRRVVDAKTGTISETLSYPDPKLNGHGFNPIFYPKLDLSYRVTGTALEGNALPLRVGPHQPLPPEWGGRAGRQF